eukprot:10695797-Alexandrium_andersonii.AAC.1
MGARERSCCARAARSRMCAWGRRGARVRARRGTRVQGCQALVRGGTRECSGLVGEGRGRCG